MSDGLTEQQQRLKKHLGSDAAAAATSRMVFEDGLTLEDVERYELMLQQPSDDPTHLAGHIADQMTFEDEQWECPEDQLSNDEWECPECGARNHAELVLCQSCFSGHKSASSCASTLGDFMGVQTEAQRYADKENIAAQMTADDDDDVPPVEDDVATCEQAYIAALTSGDTAATEAAELALKNASKAVRGDSRSDRVDSIWAAMQSEESNRVASIMKSKFGKNNPMFGKKKNKSKIRGVPDLAHDDSPLQQKLALNLHNVQRGWILDGPTAAACEWCGKKQGAKEDGDEEVRLSRCGRCQSVRYCSKVRVVQQQRGLS